MCHDSGTTLSPVKLCFRSVVCTDLYCGREHLGHLDAALDHQVSPHHLHLVPGAQGQGGRVEGQQQANQHAEHLGPA